MRTYLTKKTVFNGIICQRIQSLKDQLLIVPKTLKVTASCIFVLLMYLSANSQIIEDPIYKDTVWAETDTICIGDSSLHSMPEIDYATSYNWYDDGTAIIYGYNQPSSIFVYTAAATPGLHLSTGVTFIDGASDTLHYYLQYTYIWPRPNATIFAGITSGCVKQQGPTEGVDSVCLPACDSSWVWYYAAYEPGNTYIWNVDGEISYTTDNDSLHVHWGAMGGGSITLIVINEHGCTDTMRSCVEINETPNAYFGGVPDSGGYIYLCIGTLVTFYDSSFVTEDMGDVTYHWDFGDSTEAEGNDPQEHAYDEAGTYHVVLTVTSECGCSDTFSRDIIVDYLPGVVIECPSILCAGDTDDYYTLNNCPDGYLWSVTGGTIVEPMPYGSVIHVVWDSPASGYGTVSLPGATCDSVCRATTTIRVPVINDNVDIIGPTIACFGDLEYYSMPSWPGTHYNWSITYFVAGGITETKSGNPIEVAMPYSDGTVRVTVHYTNPTTGCEGNDTLIVHLLPLMNITGIRTICDHHSYSFTVNPTVIGGSVNWTVQDAGGSTLGTVTGSNTISGSNWPFGPGEFTLTASDPVHYCEDAVITITVVANPATPSLITGEEEICPGATETYTASGYGSDTYLSWVAIHGNVLASSGSTAVVEWGATGPYRIGVFAVSNASPHCPGDTLWLDIDTMVISPPDSIGPDTVCVNSSFDYDATTAGVYKYEWSIDADILGSIATGQGTGTVRINWHNTPTLPSDPPATISVKMYYCNTSRIVTYLVYIRPMPEPEITYPATICQRNTATFGVVKSGTASVLTGTDFEWDFGDGTIIHTGTATADHIYSDAGTFTVGVTITDPDLSCIGSVHTSYEITVLPTPDVYVSTPDPLAYPQCPGDPAPTLATTLYGTIVAGTGSGGMVTWQWIDDATGLPVTTGMGGTTATYVPSVVGCYHLEAVDANTCTGRSNSICIRTNCGSGDDDDCDPVTTTTEGYMEDCADVTLSGALLDNTKGRVLGWTVYDPFQGDHFYDVAMPLHHFAHSGFYDAKVYYRIENGSPPPDSCDVNELIHIEVPLHDSMGYTITCGTGGNYDLHLYDYSDYISAYSLTATQTWTLTPAIGSPIVDYGPHPTISLPAGTSYTVNLSVSVDDGVNYVTCDIDQNITMPVIGSAAFTIDDDVVCEGTPVHFTYSSSDPDPADIISYLWDFGDLAGSTLGPNTLREFSWTGLSNPKLNSVNLIIIDKFGCTYTQDHDVQVFRNGLGGFLDPPYVNLCPGDIATIDFTDGGISSPTTYHWSNVATGVPLSTSIAGSYTLTISDAQCMYAIPAPSIVTVLPLDHLSLSGISEYCEGDPLSVHAPYNPDFTYTWSINGTPYGSGFDLYAYATVGMSLVTLEIHDSRSGCDIAPLSFPILVHALPDPPTISPGSGCYPPSSLFTASTSTPPIFSYNWNTGQTTASIHSTHAGSYTCYIIDAFGCRSPTESAYVEGLPDFSNLIEGCYEVCDTALPFIIPGISGSFDSYAWIVNGVVVSSASGGGISTIPDLIFSNPPGDYSIRLAAATDYAGCADTSDSLSLTILSCVPCPITATQEDIYCDPDSAHIHFNYLLHNTGTHSAELIQVSSVEGSILWNTLGTIGAGGTLTLEGLIDPLPFNSTICLEILTRTLQVDSSWDTCSNTVCFEIPACDGCHLTFTDPDQVHCDTLAGMFVFTFRSTVNYVGSGFGAYSWTSNEGYPVYSTGASPDYLDPSAPNYCYYTITIPRRAPHDSVCLTLMATDTLTHDTCYAEFCYVDFELDCGPCDSTPNVKQYAVYCTDSEGVYTFSLSFDVPFNDWYINILNPYFAVTGGSPVSSDSAHNVLTGTISGLGEDTTVCFIVQYTNTDDSTFVCCDSVCIYIPACDTQSDPCHIQVMGIRTIQLKAPDGSVDYSVTLPIKYYGGANALWFATSSTSAVATGRPIRIRPAPVVDTLEFLFDNVSINGVICLTLHIYDSISDTWCEWDTCFTPTYTTKNLSDSCMKLKPGSKVVKDSCWEDAAGIIEHIINFNGVINNTGRTQYIVAAYSSCGPALIRRLVSPPAVLSYSIPPGTGASGIYIHVSNTSGCDPICYTLIVRDSLNNYCRLTFCLYDSCKTAHHHRMMNPDHGGNEGVKEDIKASKSDIGQDDAVLAIVPNPTINSSTLYYEFNDKESVHYIRVQSMQGQEIRRMVVYENKGSLKIDTEDMAAGLYLVQVWGGQRMRQTLKWIVIDN